jgi:tetratricopeptide (TPR) repeat protein
MGRTVLIHHHIFKNAGTSFNHGLKNSFGDAYFEYDPPGSKVTTAIMLCEFIVSHPQALAISGHHICLPTPQGSDFQTRSSILIRQPLARIRSIYGFERKQQAQTVGAIRAKELGFRDYVLWRLETSPNVYCNYQTLYCSRTDNVSPIYLATEADLDLAIQNLRNCSVVGTVERYAETLTMAQYEFSQSYEDLVLKAAHLNPTAGVIAPYSTIRADLVNDLGEELVDRLEALNQLDQRLYEVADELLTNWFATQPTAKAEYYQTTGDNLVKAGRLEQAKSAYNAALSLKAGWFKPYYSLATVQERLGEFALSLENYQKVIELKPDFAWAYFGIGNIFYGQDRLDQAIEYYGKAIDVHPPEKSLVLRLKLGDALVGAGRVGEAIETYLQSDQIVPDSADVKFRLSVAYLQNQDWQCSEDFGLRALELNPERSDTYVTLGDILYGKGELRRAIDYYRKGSELAPDNRACIQKLEELTHQLENA